MDWLSAREIAEAAKAGLLPGLPTTKRGVNALADRERWADTPLARLRPGRKGGGGLEYHVDVLPWRAQLVWRQHHLALEDVDFGPVLVYRPIDPRRVILRKVDAFQRELLSTREIAELFFCKQYNRGDMPMPAWVKKGIRAISPRTLRRWRRVFESEARRSESLWNDRLLAQAMDDAWSRMTPSARAAFLAERRDEALALLKVEGARR